jgi:hypothetical protein
MQLRYGTVLAFAVLTMAACGSPTEPQPLNPGTAPRAAVDRFSADAGHLFVRDGSNGLPAANEAIDFDQAPFITQGLGPDGRVARYYNFDVQPTAPAPIFVLFQDGSTTPVEDQLNIIDVIPGDEGYNDFWQVVKVTVPADYVANTATSLQDLIDAGYPMETTAMLVNCPVVPEGSVASEGGGADGLSWGWYKDQVVFYFAFAEATLTTTMDGNVPTSPIYVAFNTNPDQTGGGPGSGFMHQGTSDQSHNVVATLPGDAGYSPLWDVIPYDNASFDEVYDLASATAASNFGVAAQVNCPIVFMGDPPGDADTATHVMVDRFSADAGTLFVRDGSNGLPGANEAIDFDQGEPFVTQGLGPAGEVIRYYNFDVQSTTPAPIYALFYESGGAVPRQLNIVDVIPGDAGYNDFWQVVKVTVPDSYVANTATSLQDLMDAGYDMETTTTLVNCPIVPEGSTASERLSGGETGLSQGWYQGELVFYFNFVEAPLTATGMGDVPTSPIYVAFNINPDQTGGGPASGFMTETGTTQTHNVVATLPGGMGYSPLWDVIPYDNASFNSVSDLTSAMAASNFGVAAQVNCPVVFIQ